MSASRYNHRLSDSKHRLLELGLTPAYTCTVSLKALYLASGPALYSRGESSPLIAKLVRFPHRQNQRGILTVPLVGVGSRYCGCVAIDPLRWARGGVHHAPFRKIDNFGYPVIGTAGNRCLLYALTQKQALPLPWSRREWCASTRFIGGIY